MCPEAAHCSLEASKSESCCQATVYRRGGVEEGAVRGGGGLHCCPHPLTVLRHHHVKIKSAWPWIIDFLFPSINSLPNSRFGSRWSPRPAMRRQGRSTLLVTDLIWCFLILKPVTMLRVSLCFLLSIIMTFRVSNWRAEVQGEVFFFLLV